MVISSPVAPGPFADIAQSLHHGIQPFGRPFVLMRRIDPENGPRHFQQDAVTSLQLLPEHVEPRVVERMRGLSVAGVLPEARVQPDRFARSRGRGCFGPQLIADPAQRFDVGRRSTVTGQKRRLPVLSLPRNRIVFVVPTMTKWR